MRYMTSKEIRDTWLNYFKDKGHAIEPSASLVPVNDKTLLWINAGVAPLKKYFDGRVKPENPRIANVQKCIRTNDIENVGLTARHHTFFEMLGNFSIGDYFKKEAIDFGFEILTSEKYFGFPVDLLYFTYFPTDLETKNLWLKKGIKEDHIIPVEGNYWEIGDGPSGPNTEIFFDRGSYYDKRGSELIRDDLENDRFIEIWNIVFSQFNAKAGLKRSEYEELPSKNIDTGAGLERFACVLQGTKTNFETDLFYPIIQEIEKMTNIEYDGQKEFKIIADHIRTLTLSISDGAMLSNEGRGYVLRRLLRRALKHAKNINLHEAFLYKLVDVVVKMMSSFYGDLVKNQEMIKTIIYKEELKFLETLQEGERHFEKILKDSTTNSIKGEDAFKLYDTYGFPIELTIEYANEHEASVDVDGFYLELEKQRSRSRAARKQISSFNEQDEELLAFNLKSTFVGYDVLNLTTEVIKVFDNGIVLKETPFYATSGGQVCDKGTINDYEVIDVSKLPNGQHLHILANHDLQEGDQVVAQVDENNRREIAQNHSATHLLHQALKDVLGSHVNQQGSLVNENYLRFDFNHYESIDKSDLLKIERIVKNKILNNLQVVIKQMSIEEAKKLGAMALFGEKYGNIVRVVNMENYSIELCGGTHVKSTGDIIDFAITNLESIGSGIYRVEAISGPEITTLMKLHLDNLFTQRKEVYQKSVEFGNKQSYLGQTVIGSYQDVLEAHNALNSMREILKTLEKQAKDLETKKLLSDVLKYVTNDCKRQVIKTNIDQKVLKEAIDIIYDKIKAETIFIVNEFDNRLTFVCKSDGKIHAGNLVKKAASISNGSGGGRDTMAQGGTSNLDLADEVVKAIQAEL